MAYTAPADTAPAPVDDGEERRRRVFPAFPYEPYEIQQRFMTHLYDTLQEGGVGILESPTGTGKTLSIICSALQWLADQKRAAEEGVEGGDSGEPSTSQRADGDEPDWLRDFSVHDEKRKRQERKARRERRRERARAEAAQFRKSVMATLTGPRDRDNVGTKAPGGAEGERKRERKSSGEAGGEDAEFVLEEWESDQEARLRSAKRAGAARAGDTCSSEEFSASSDSDVELETQIIFCSRTHSQLSQVVGEVKRTTFAKDMRVVALGGRKQLCVNPAVQPLSAARANERCLELQRSKAPAASKAAKAADAATTTAAAKTASRRKAPAKGSCPFLKKKAGPMHKLKEAILAEPLDIEDLARVAARRFECCGYYAARKAQAEADLVLMPYNSLVHNETREALGVRLQGNVVIVDEAHNLVDAINAVHSVPVTGVQMKGAVDSLTAYINRFRTRLSPANLRHLQTMLMLASSFLRRMQPTGGGARSGGGTPDATQSGSSSTSHILSLNDFLFQAGVDNVNLRRLQRYVRESKVIFKVSSYSEALAAGEAGVGGDCAHRLGALHSLAALIQALASPDGDGRVLLECGPALAACSVKFLLLDASSRFATVVEKARAVILAGGTLQPTTEMARQLFPGALAAGRVSMLSCPHIVPKENLLCLTVPVGPAGRRLLLNHKTRTEGAVVAELGQLLINVCRVVPEGVVAFFPSFDYEELVHAAWSKSGVLNSLGALKQVFREPRTALEVESTLKAYAECIAECAAGSPAAGPGTPKPRTGGVILSVVGGKLSEGINFSDGLGRCVVMFGLPYANPSDPELKETMQYLDALKPHAAAASPGASTAHPVARGREYYENLCMRAVNQSIGRAIRHRNDYAAILLVDERWTSTKSSNGISPPIERLPGWIKSSIQMPKSFGQSYAKVLHFFKSREAITTPTT